MHRTPDNPRGLQPPRFRHCTTCAGVGHSRYGHQHGHDDIRLGSPGLPRLARHGKRPGSDGPAAVVAKSVRRMLHIGGHEHHLRSRIHDAPQGDRHPHTRYGRNAPRFLHPAAHGRHARRTRLAPTVELRFQENNTAFLVPGPHGNVPAAGRRKGTVRRAAGSDTRHPAGRGRPPGRSA